MPPDQTQLEAAAPITTTSPAVPTAGGDAGLDTAVGIGDSEELDTIGLENVGQEVADDARVDPIKPQPSLPTANSRSPELPAAGGDTPLDNAVALGIAALFKENAMVGPTLQLQSPTATSRSPELSAAGGDTLLDDVFAFAFDALLEENAKANPPSEKKEKTSDKRLYLRNKLSAKLKSRPSLKSYENSSEEKKFNDFEKTMSDFEQAMRAHKEKNAVSDFEQTMRAEEEKAEIETYETMIVEVKKMQRKLKVREFEYDNRKGTLQTLQNSIENLCSVQRDLHKVEISRALLLAEKVKAHMNMMKFEDPIVFCADLDNLRKKIEQPRRPPVEDFASTPIEDLMFHAERNDFASFIGHLRNRFIDHDQYEKIKDSFLLPLQDVDQQPPKWLRIHLFGRGDNKVILYVRGDNGYLVAFQNKHGLFELGPGDRPLLSKLIPGSKFVYCNFDYPSMMNFERSPDDLPKDELKKRLKALKLDGKAMLDYIDNLSDYSYPLPDGDVKSFQIAVAGTTIMICEVSRIIQLLSAVENGWLSGTQLNELLLQYMWNWKLVSKAFRSWRTNKGRMFSMKLRELVKMVYAEEAGSVLFLVLNRKVGAQDDDDDDDDDLPGDGQNGDEPDVQPDDGANESNSEHQPPTDNSQHQGSSSSDDDDGNDGDGANESNSARQPPQGNSKRQQHQGSAALRGDMQQQAPHLRRDAADDEDATCTSSSAIIRRHYCVSSSSQGLIDIVSYHKKHVGSKPCLSLAGLTLDEIEGFDKFPFGHCSVSPSRGLIDLLTDVNKPMPVYTRKYPVSLPPGSKSTADYPVSLPSGSKSTADSSSPYMEGLIGQFFVEILEVSANFPFVGTIMICDVYSCKTVCHRDDWNQAYKAFSSGKDEWISSGNAAVQFKDKIELIGPSRATTADCGFVIKVCIPATRTKPMEICRLSCSSNDSKLYNKVQTYTMKTDRGCLFVTCSVMPEAMQGFIDVGLQLKRRYARNAKVYGSVIAYIDKFDIGSTLFQKDIKEAVPLAVPLFQSDSDSQRKGYTLVRVPLTRSILAVPVGKVLHVKGTLQVCGYDEIKITIDHFLSTDHERVKTFWIRHGESLSSVRLSLNNIF